MEREAVLQMEPRGRGGLLVAEVGGEGAWPALRCLRGAMQRVGRGADARATFVTAMAEDGRVVTVQDRDARMLALGYRLLERVGFAR